MKNEPLVQKEKKPAKEVLPKFEFTKSIRCNPKKVRIKDLEMGIETEYPSLYRAGRTIGYAAKTLTRNDAMTLKDKYEITIL